MKYIHHICGLMLLTFVLSSCDTGKVVSQSAPEPEVRSNPEEPDDESKLVRDYFVDEDSLSYNDYNLIKKFKEVKIEEMTGLTEVSYAILIKNGKTLAKFDGMYHPIGNLTDFGMFPLLGGETKQLVVSQTIPRGGRHWIVSLSPSFRIIYDSDDYGLGREDMTVVDVDKNGVYEITQELTAFVFFEDITVGASHIIDVVFKYDDKSKKYLPASHIFRDYTLTGANVTGASINRNDEKAFAGDVLRVMLPYIYAGERDKAWEFYERECTLLNKEELKGKIVAQLEDDAVYQHIYRKP